MEALLYIFLTAGFAGTAQAIKDTVNFTYEKSVFKLLNEEFWNPNKGLSISLKYKNWLKKFGMSVFFFWGLHAWSIFNLIEYFAIGIAFIIAHLYSPLHSEFFGCILIFYIFKKFFFLMNVNLLKL
jgi:hypothetical protein